MAVIRWGPSEEPLTLREAIDRLFEGRFVRPAPWWASEEEEGCELAIDARATDEDIVITANVPGIDPGDVEITIDGDILTIKGEIKKAPDNVDYFFQERPCGKFHRTLRLGIPVEAAQAEATFNKGVLTLTIPKQEKVKPKSIKVKTK